ncbi:MAG: hypothetical protein ACK47B_14450 [Armatimonadota bacterium]
MSIDVDNRKVVLLKSLRTNNRFYALVDPDSGMKNADAIAEFPPDLLLGIAYPCLEDGLNDFAVIRTTFETIDVFPDDDELRAEMLTIIDDARGKMIARLEELRDRIVCGQAHFLGTDLNEFKQHAVHMATKGTIRRQLDSMMKVDVFESVAKTEAALSGGGSEPMFRYQFLPEHSLATIGELPPRVFIGRLFDDILDSVNQNENYQNKYVFDRNVFQKFIAVMFVNYATTDPMFYGTSRDDYGVSSEKDMQTTPLYVAVKKALQDLEQEVRDGSIQLTAAPTREGAPVEPAGVAASSAGAPPAAAAAPEAAPAEGDLSFLFDEQEDDFTRSLREAGHTVELPFGAGERMLLEPLTRLADALRLLGHLDNPRVNEARKLAAEAGQQVFQGLKELRIISPLASDPLEDFNHD